MAALGAAVTPEHGRATSLSELRLAGNRGLALPPMHVTYAGIPAVFRFLEDAAHLRPAPLPHRNSTGGSDLAVPRGKWGGVLRRDSGIGRYVDD